MTTTHLPPGGGPRGGSASDPGSGPSRRGAAALRTAAPRFAVAPDTVGHVSDAIPSRPVRVAAANDYDVIVAGLASMLGAFPDEVEVRDRILVGEPIRNGPVDVVLYDTYGRTGAAAEALAELSSLDEVRHVAVFSLDLSPSVIAEARAAGARGAISKALSAEAICKAIVQVAQGEEVVALSAPDSGPAALGLLDWPGKDEGLSERESEVLVLVAEGLTNKEIAAALYVGTETVKTHISQVLAKLGLRNRTEAAAYVHRVGGFARHERATLRPSG